MSDDSYAWKLITTVPASRASSSFCGPFTLEACHVTLEPPRVSDSKLTLHLPFSVIAARVSLRLRQYRCSTKLTHRRTHTEDFFVAGDTLQYHSAIAGFSSLRSIKPSWFTSAEIMQ